LRQFNQLSQTPQIGDKYQPAARGQAVVAPPLLTRGRVQGRVRVRFRDHILLEQRAKAPVERSRAKAEAPCCGLLHLLHDGVSMALTVSEREQDMKARAGEGKQPVETIVIVDRGHGRVRLEGGDGRSG
jgi:hypothetical protein